MNLCYYISRRACAVIKERPPKGSFLPYLSASNRATIHPSRHFVGDIGHLFIREAVLRNSQLPATVSDEAAGLTYTRPAKWV
jgi:hypothetical protein